MAFTTNQLTTLATHIKANTDPAVVAALAARNDGVIAEIYNGEGTTVVWKTSVSNYDLFENTDVAKFDNLTAGKRDAWRLLLDFAPANFSRGKTRKAVQDVWGNTDSVSILQAGTRTALKIEEVFGGNVVTTNTVSATKLNYEGAVSTYDISVALNNNP